MVQKFSKFFHSQNTVRVASILLIVTLSLSNVLGLIRDHFLAQFIDTADLDIYFAAFRIPDLVFNFLILGAVFSALVPVFSEFVANKEYDRGFYVVNSILNMAVVAMGISAVLVYLTMPFLGKLVVPEFSDEKIAATVRLSRLLMLTPIFFSISYVLSGVLNTFNRFVAYSLAPLAYNLSIIIGILTLGRTSLGVEGVVYFVIIGSVLHLLIQLPTAIKLGYRYRYVFDYKNIAVRRILKLMLPRTVALGVNQILLLIYTSIASALAAGSIAAFNFANNIQTVPTVIFGSSIATAIFPTLTLAASNNEDNKFCVYINKTIRTIAYILIPISVAIFLLRAQIIRMILGSGSFAWSDTEMTARVLGYFALSLLPQGLIPLFTRAFFAVKNTKTPMYIAIIAAVFGIIFAYLLVPNYGVAALAISFGISSYLNAIILYFELNRIPCYKPDRSVLVSLIKVVIISFIMALSMQYLKHFYSRYVNMDTFVGVFTQSFLVVATSLIVYLILSKIIGLKELKWALKRKVE